MRVFVYGTLKRGWHNHRLLATAQFVGNATLDGTHVLLDAGFPVCMVHPQGATVTGEVYEVDGRTLANLDQLEGEGRMYHRQPKEITYADGTADVAWTYMGGTHWWKRANIAAQWLADGLYTYERPGIRRENIHDDGPGTGPEFLEFN